MTRIAPLIEHLCRAFARHLTRAASLALAAMIVFGSLAEPAAAHVDIQPDRSSVIENGAGAPSPAVDGDVRAHCHCPQVVRLLGGFTSPARLTRPASFHGWTEAAMRPFAPSLPPRPPRLP